MGKNAAGQAVKDRLVVGISGASGVVYGIRLLEALRELGVESHLVMSKAAQLTVGLETKLTPKSVAAKADFQSPDSINAWHQARRSSARRVDLAIPASPFAPSIR